MSDKNLEQQISIKFYVKIGKSASETSLLTLAYGEYALKKLFLNGIGSSRKGEKMCKMTQGHACMFLPSQENSSL
jgi:hypothetical protein